MMQEQLQESKKKLQQNSQNSQNQVMANKIFKNLKASFEGIKDVISKLEERKIQQQDINELQQQIQSKE